MSDPSPPDLAGAFEDYLERLEACPDSLARAESLRSVLAEVSEIETTLRTLRGLTISALRAEEFTFEVIGELFGVSPQRASQLATATTTREDQS